MSGIDTREYKVTTVSQGGGTVYKHRYGLTFRQPLSPLALEQYCFRTGRKSEEGGMGKYLHFRQYAAMLFPNRIWHEWSEDRFRVLCDDSYAIKLNDTVQREICWAGCSSSGKTYDAAFWAFLWWLAAPAGSIVCLTSTTAGMVRKRIWEPIQRFYHEVSKMGFVGHLVDSKTTLQSRKGDEKHAIFAKAVGGGETTQAAGDIQGMHPSKGRLLLVLDEAAEVREAIELAKENMMSGCQDFTALYIGNPKARTDVLGRHMEPKDGWASVTVDTEEWLTKKGICQRFDGFKSPNVKAKKTLFQFLFTWEDYQFTLQAGEENTLAHWMFKRGFPPPDGVLKTVLSEALIEQRNGRGKHTFVSHKTVIAGLDPAFGGDDCILRIADMGDILRTDGTTILGLTLTHRYVINIDASNPLPKEHQIAEQVIKLCKQHNVELLGTDSTGIGRGVFSKLFDGWPSNKLFQVEFGGEPSNLAASEIDLRPSYDVYDRKVSELWFTIARFVDSGQLKGFDSELIREVCARLYDYKSRKLAVETKDKFKLHYGHSPDDGDCLAVLCDVARRNGMTPATVLTTRTSDSWNEAARKLDMTNYTSDIEESGARQSELFEWMAP